MCRHGRLARLVAPLVGVALVVAGLGPLASIAAEEETEVIGLQLVSQPIWHGLDDDLDLKLRIVNRGPAALEGFNLSLVFYPKVSSRSALHASFDGPSGFSGSFPKPYPTRHIPPGNSTTVTIHDALSTLPLLGQATEEGVYPLTIQLYDAAGLEALDSVTTQILYYPEETESPRTPLNFVLVMPFTDAPRRGPDGIFRTDDAGEWPLQSALAPGGWLVGLMDALETKAGLDLHLGVAPTPRLMEEIADMANGFRRGTGGITERVDPGGPVAEAAASWLRRMTALLERDGSQPLLVPYSFPDLPSLGRHLGTLSAQDEIVAGEQVLTQTLGVDVERSALFAPGGRVDQETLTQTLRPAAAADLTFFYPDALEPAVDPSLEGCPERSPSFTCPMYVDTFSGRTSGYASDRGLQERLSDLGQSGDARRKLQNFFAETAMIREELPSVAGRVVQSTMPASWQPTPRLSRLLVRGLAHAPWLNTWTPREGLHNGVDAVERAIVTSLPQAPAEPDEFFWEDVAETNALVDHFASLEPPEALTTRLAHNVLAAHSRSLWPEGRETIGEDYVDATRGEIDAELDKIRVSGVDEITLTSRRGEIQFPLINDTGYPVELSVRLESQDLEIQDPVVSLTAEPTQQLAFDVRAQSSGTFPLTVKVETPDGFVVAEKQIGIRSTKFNQIALGITFGALAFLVGFYVVRSLRRRRKPAAPNTGATQA